MLDKFNNLTKVKKKPAQWFQFSNMISCGCFTLNYQFHSSCLKIMIELTIKDLSFFQKICFLCIDFSFLSIPTRWITRTHPPPNLYHRNNTVIQSKIVQLLIDNSGHAYRRLAQSKSICRTVPRKRYSACVDAGLPLNWCTCNACGNDTLANSSLRFSSHLPSCP